MQCFPSRNTYKMFCYLIKMIFILCSMKKWENHTLAYIAELINTSILELWKAYTSTEESWTGYLYDQWKHPRKKKKSIRHLKYFIRKYTNTFWDSEILSCLKWAKNFIIYLKKKPKPLIIHACNAHICGGWAHSVALDFCTKYFEIES